MNLRFTLARIALPALALLAACGPAMAQGELAAAKRIVSLGGAVTEIVYALGEQDRLAGRDSTSSHPAQATTLPDVGYMRALSPEGVLSVAPDGIIAIEGSGPPEAVAVLKAGAIPFVEVPERFSREGIVEKVRIVGDALGVPEKAQALAAEIDARLVEAEKRAAAATDRPRVMFVISMQGGKVMAAGRGTAAAAIIELSGATNVFDSFQGYRQVADEAVIAAAPEAILMMDRAGDHAATDAELFAHPAVSPTPAGQARKVVRMDGLTLLGFGPRTAQAVDELSAALHPAGGAPAGQ